MRQRLAAEYKAAHESQNTDIVASDILASCMGTEPTRAQRLWCGSGPSRTWSGVFRLVISEGIRVTSGEAGEGLNVRETVKNLKRQLHKRARGGWVYLVTVHLSAGSACCFPVGSPLQGQAAERQRQPCSQLKKVTPTPRYSGINRKGEALRKHGQEASRRPPGGPQEASRRRVGKEWPALAAEGHREGHMILQRRAHACESSVRTA